MNPVVTILISAGTGGLAGAILNQLFVKRTIRLTLHAQSKDKAVQAFNDWATQVLTGYMNNEAKWVGGVRNQLATPTQNSPEYLSLREKADIAIKTNFPSETHAAFVDFGQWVDKVLFEAFAQSSSFPFKEFRQKRDSLTQTLTRQ